MVDQEIKKWGTDVKTKKLKNISGSLATENQKKEVPIHWEVKQTEYDSGPKMGID
jgi:hypothetical protein